MANPFTDVGGLSSTVSSITGTAAALGVRIGAAILGVLLIGLFIWYKYNKKSYNIPVTIWIPRSDGKLLDEIDATGGFFRVRQPEGGFVTEFRLKRKGSPVLAQPPPSSHFLIGLRRKLYLIQKGIDDFEPVIPDSFREVTTETGEVYALTELKCINQAATAWVEDNRENAKRRFILHGFWEKYKDFIQMSIFIFIVMIAIYINWSGLKEVAIALQGATKGVCSAASNVIN